jgi:hypothetical protein
MVYEDTILSMLGLGSIATIVGTLLVVWIIVAVAIYVYFALALMTVAKKLKHKDIAWLAWIPIANFFLFPILAKKHWAWGFILLVPLVNMVFSIIWTWNIYEQRKYPGWLSLIPVLSIIPVVGFVAGIGNLIVWGLVAWKDQ